MSRGWLRPQNLREQEFVDQIQEKLDDVCAQLTMTLVELLKSKKLDDVKHDVNESAHERGRIDGEEACGTIERLIRSVVSFVPSVVVSEAQGVSDERTTCERSASG